MILRDDILLLDVGGTTIKCGDGRCVPVLSAGSRDDIAAALHDAVWPTAQRSGEGFGKRETYPSGNASLTPAPAPQQPQPTGQPRSNETDPAPAPQQPQPTGQPHSDRHGRPDRPSRIGVAIPGPFDYERGVFLMKHKFEAVYGESFRVLAGLPEDADVRFVHDVVAVLNGVLGMRDRRSDVALITLGTGLGFAYAKDGQVQVGPSGSPARPIYNIPWGDGILEDYASARGIRAAYERFGGDKETSAAIIARKAYGGDEQALAAYSLLGETLGEALAPVLEELDITTLLVGGQISRSLSLFERPLSNALEGVTVLPAPDGAVFAGIASLFDLTETN